MVGPYICVKSGIIQANVKYIGEAWSLPSEDVRMGHSTILFQKDVSLIQRSGAIFDFLDNLNFDNGMPHIMAYLCTF